MTSHQRRPHFHSTFRLWPVSRSGSTVFHFHTRLQPLQARRCRFGVSWVSMRSRPCEAALSPSFWPVHSCSVFHFPPTTTLLRSSWVQPALRTSQRHRLFVRRLKRSSWF